MFTATITIDSMMDTFAHDLLFFSERTCKGGSDVRDVFFCYIKRNRGYRDHVVNDLDALNQFEDDAIPMFAKSAAVLFATCPSTSDIMRSLSSFLALYLYISKNIRRTANDARSILTKRKAISYSADLWDPPYTEQDVENDAIRMATTHYGICSEETLASVYVCLLKLRNLLWESPHKEDLLLAQQNEKEEAISIVDSCLHNKD